MASQPANQPLPEPESLAALYDKYASRLFTYATSLMGDEHAAADVTHDTILIAADRIGQLRDPSRLRPWLYAICRNACLRELRQAKRTVSIDESTEAVGRAAATSVDFDSELDASTAAELVAGAMAGMSDGDREVLELALRHNLDYAEVSAVMGVGANNARARVGRCRASLAASVGSLLLFRGRPGRCAALDRLVDGQQFTPLVRKRISRHAQACSACSGSRNRAVQAIATASLPLLVLPALLRSRILADGDSSLVSSATWLENAPRFDSAGWPNTAGNASSTTRAIAFGAAGVALVMAGLGISIAQAPERSDTEIGTKHDETSSASDTGPELPLQGAVIPPPSSSSAKPKPSRSNSPSQSATAQPTPSSSASTWTPYRTTPTPTRNKKPSGKPTGSSSPTTAPSTSATPSTSAAPSTSAPAPPPPPPVDPSCLPWSSDNPGGYTTPAPPAGC
ncbi:MAG: sigma-70 family RNA polymerase sigma factor [Candidatus Nanopelagicales bacterium]|nr:sigma-70 family RNA polymerase sigma factor [Candidatus Nanopelagicales bacterium]